jgi:hypothetical protein
MGGHVQEGRSTVAIYYFQGVIADRTLYPMSASDWLKMELALKPIATNTPLFIPDAKIHGIQRGFRDSEFNMRSCC